MSRSSSMPRASSSSDELSPNLLWSPPLSAHLPEPALESLMRMPILGRTPRRSDISAISRSSFSFPPPGICGVPFLGQQCQFDIALVLVSVADYQGVGIGVGGQYRVQLRLGTGFETDVEFGAIAHNFFHDLAHLIYLNGVDHIVLRRVSVARGSFAEAVRNLFDAVVQDIREAQ